MRSIEERTKLFNENDRLVHYVVRIVVRRSKKLMKHEQDMLQESRMAMWRCTDSWSDSFGAKFGTYAAKSMFRACNDWLQRKVKHGKCMLFSDYKYCPRTAQFDYFDPEFEQYTSYNQTNYENNLIDTDEIEYCHDIANEIDMTGEDEIINKVENCQFLKTHEKEVVINRVFMKRSFVDMARDKGYSKQRSQQIFSGAMKKLGDYYSSKMEQAISCSA